MILYDQLGSGRSDRPTDTTLFQIDRYVRELDSLRRALRLDRVHLYGHSWGTMLALEYLATHPRGVVSVTLASQVISMAAWAADGKALVATLPDSVQGVIATHEANGTTSSPEYQAANLRSFDRSATLAQLELPVLLTAGRNDEARPETVERFAKTGRNAEVRIFDQSAHLAMFTEREAYVAAVRAFLRKHDR